MRERALHCRCRCVVARTHGRHRTPQAHPEQTSTVARSSVQSHMSAPAAREGAMRAAWLRFASRPRGVTASLPALGVAQLLRLLHPRQPSCGLALSMTVAFPASWRATTRRANRVASCPKVARPPKFSRFFFHCKILFRSSQCAVRGPCMVEFFSVECEGDGGDGLAVCVSRDLERKPPRGPKSELAFFCVKRSARG